MNTNVFAPIAITEIIELSLPTNTAYLSTARLTASSIANRQGFDIDEMEDIKSAVSEACAYVIRKAQGRPCKLFRLIFSIGDGFVDIQLSSDGGSFAADEDEMSLLIMEALMDDLTLCTNGGRLELRMRKTHQ